VRAELRTDTSNAPKRSRTDITLSSGGTVFQAAQPIAAIETLLEMARRHVWEGVIRVVRQEEIVSELERVNYPETATFDRNVLKTMRLSLDLMKQHLWAIEERWTS
jgi:hypothetical protein